MPAGPDVIDGNPAVPEREIYYVAVSSNALTADIMQQFVTATPAAGIETVRQASDRLLRAGAFLACIAVPSPMRLRSKRSLPDWRAKRLIFGTASTVATLSAPRV